jgi:hypothetical protein
VGCRWTDLLPGFFDDVAVVDDGVFEPERKADGKGEHVVAAALANLDLRPLEQLAVGKVVDDDIDVVLLPPPLDVLAVEPEVVVGQQVIPLGDPQRSPLARVCCVLPCCLGGLGRRI